jgi:hypothetical protein
LKDHRPGAARASTRGRSGWAVEAATPVIQDGDSLSAHLSLSVFQPSSPYSAKLVVSREILGNRGPVFGVRFELRSRGGCVGYAPIRAGHRRCPGELGGGNRVPEETRCPASVLFSSRLWGRALSATTTTCPRFEGGTQLLVQIAGGLLLRGQSGYEKTAHAEKGANGSETDKKTAGGAHR